MTCIEVQEQISAFIDGQMRSGEAATIFGHIGSCGECLGFLQASIRMRGMLSRIAPPQVSRDLDARVLAIPLEARTKVRARERRVRLATLWQQRLRVPVPALAAGLTLAILTTVLSFWLWLNPLGQMRQEVVYVFGLPQVEVYATPGASAADGQRQQ